MAEKKMEEAVVVSQEEIASGIFSMWIHVPEISALAGPGQFVSLYCRDASRLLPRPISICEIDGKWETSGWCTESREKGPGSSLPMDREPGFR